MERTGRRTVRDQSAAGAEVSSAILAAARAGDPDAFTALVEHYDPRLRTLAYHLLGNPDQTDDALQDAYVKAFRGLHTFAGRSALSTWLTRITYTTCIDHLRRRARLVLVPDLEPEKTLPDGPDPTDDLSDRGWVRDALRRLPPEQRAVVVLVGVQGLDYQQAAEILGIPSGTVASRLSTARTVLRSALRGGGDESAADTIEEVTS
jgi:RNA polymerase sigma-70 factor (ECF subfamily)